MYMMFDHFLAHSGIAATIRRENAENLEETEPELEGETAFIVEPPTRENVVGPR